MIQDACSIVKVSIAAVLPIQAANIPGPRALPYRFLFTAQRRVDRTIYFQRVPQRISTMSLYKRSLDHPWILIMGVLARRPGP